jgi:hypothetical protein
MVTQPGPRSDRPETGPFAEDATLRQPTGSAQRADNPGADRQHTTEARDDRQNTLQNSGMTTRQPPSAPAANYLGHSHDELYAMVTQGLDPGQLGAAAQAWTRLGDAMTQFQDDVLQAVNTSSAEWQGPDGDAARGYLTGLANWVRQTGAGTTLAGSNAAVQAEAAATVKNSMPEPVHFDLDQAMTELGSTTDPLAVAGKLDHINSQYQAQQAAHRQAAEVVRVYDQTLTGPSAVQPVFEPPPALGGPAPTRVHLGGTGHTVGPPSDQTLISGFRDTPPPPAPGPPVTPVPPVLPPPKQDPPPIGVAPPKPIGPPEPVRKPIRISPPAPPVGPRPIRKPVKVNPPKHVIPRPIDEDPPSQQGGHEHKDVAVDSTTTQSVVPTAAAGPQGNGPAGPAGTGFHQPDYGPPGGSGAVDGRLSDDSLRGNQPPGPGGAGTAAARGGAGGAPIGKGRKEEDKEHERPEYLVEANPDAVFGSDEPVAPPVLGLRKSPPRQGE